MTEETTDSEKIARLNDEFRLDVSNDNITKTLGFNSLNADIQEEAILKVRHFDNFKAENNPYGERDFGAFKIGREFFFWRIDYYHKGEEPLTYGSADPSNPMVTDRVLTIMLSHEY